MSASSGQWTPKPHLRLLDRLLVDLTARRIKRLLVTMPPRHGKSEAVSHWFPAWTLMRRPIERVILASYEAEFASSWGRRVRNTVNVLAPGLVESDSRAADRWTTSQGGGMVTAGVGGPITGRGANVLIIDDPVKNAEEAESPTFRERAWEWWTSTAYTRLEPDGVVVLLQTRWHEDDLAGRILSRSAEAWTHVDLPALAESGDALGRAEGEALWPERYSRDALLAIQREVGSRVWSALYQQRPVPASGGMFKREWLDRARYRKAEVRDDLYEVAGVVVPLSSMRRFTTVDLAASVKTSADYTVIATFGVAPSGHCCVLDVRRARLEGPDIVPAIRAVVDQWKPACVWVEKVGFQLALIQWARREGIPVRELVPDRDKVARALPLSAAFEGSRMLLPAHAPWLDAVLGELLSFPLGTHDDTVDALAYGLVGMRSWTTQPGDPVAVASRHRPESSEAETWVPPSPF